MKGLVRDFFAMNSVEGSLLVGILVYWLVLSSFFVILELPHNAILIWALLGITCAYRDELAGSKQGRNKLRPYANEAEGRDI
jgi:hypothetical protein